MIVNTGLLIGLVGCATTDKLTKPKGNWIAVNPVGFIPPNTEVYKRPSTKNIEAVDQVIAEVAAVATEPALEVAATPIPTVKNSPTPTDNPSNLLQDKK